MNYVDITVLVIVVLSVFFGFKKGFLQTVTGLAALVLSLVIAVTVYPYAEAYMRKTPVYQTVYDKTASLLTVPEEETGRLSDYGTGKLNLPRDFTNNMQDKIDTASGAVSESIAETVAGAAVKIISMLTVFLIVRFLLAIITSVAGLIKKLPVIGWGDSLLGALFGLLRGLLIVYVLLAFAAFLSTMSPEGSVSRAIKYSEFAKVMYNDNVLLDFIYKD